jgi:hypothetical protein
VAQHLGRRRRLLETSEPGRIRTCDTPSERSLRGPTERISRTPIVRSAMFHVSWEGFAGSSIAVLHSSMRSMASCVRVTSTVFSIGVSLAVRSTVSVI